MMRGVFVVASVVCIGLVDLACSMNEQAAESKMVNLPEPETSPLASAGSWRYAGATVSAHDKNGNEVAMSERSWHMKLALNSAGEAIKVFLKNSKAIHKCDAVALEPSDSADQKEWNSAWPGFLAQLKEWGLAESLETAAAWWRGQSINATGTEHTVAAWWDTKSENLQVTAKVTNTKGLSWALPAVAAAWPDAITPPGHASLSPDQVAKHYGAGDNCGGSESAWNGAG